MTMQRWYSKFRALAHLPILARASTSSTSLYRFYQSTSNLQRPFSAFSSMSSQLSSHFNSSTSLVLPRNEVSFSFFPSSQKYAQLRNFSAKSKEKKWKKLTPAVSRVKKIKMKGYSSYKRRFRTLNDGTIRRWREGKRHNAHLKSKEAKRRLRKPAIVHAAYATVMKKLNFCSNF